MGNKQTKDAAKAKMGDITKLAASTGFKPEEISALYAQFMSLKGSSAAETITAVEFQAALGFRGSERSLFLDRIFELFDENRDGSINFEEFIKGISLLSPFAKPEAKLHFAFTIYDTKRRGKISQEDLRGILQGGLHDNAIPLTDRDAAKLVEETFAKFDLNKDGYIDMVEFKSMCEKTSILKGLTLNVSELIEQQMREAEAAAAAAGGAGGK